MIIGRVPTDLGAIGKEILADKGGAGCSLFPPPHINPEQKPFKSLQSLSTHPAQSIQINVKVL